MASTAGMLSAVFLVVIILHSSGNTAVTGNEWINDVTKVYSKLTKYVSQRDLGDNFRELYTNDALVLFPGPIIPWLNDTVEAENQFFDLDPFTQRYIALAELLFSSYDVAIARSIEYLQLTNGGQKKVNGLHLFVQDENKVKIKMGVLNIP